jgi:hypothetical protein
MAAPVAMARLTVNIPRLLLLSIQARPGVSEFTTRNEPYSTTRI